MTEVDVQQSAVVRLPSPALSREVAAQAGHDSWASWAGRESPRMTGGKARGDEFRWLFLMAKRHLWPSTRNPIGCPICTDQKPKDERITLWCGCSVCEDCMRGWSSAQLDEASHSAARFVLKCPMCRAVVRPCDAKHIMTLGGELYRQHSRDLLAKTLREDPDFVACPKCRGGGIIDEACMQAKRQQRREAINFHVDNEARVCIVFSVVSGGVSLALAWRRNTTFTMGWLVFGILAYSLYFVSRKVLDVKLRRSRQVQCPDCQATFVHREGNQGDDESMESEAWVRRNCRKCPRCNANIQKNGGCNHMRCQSCRVDFCWACMKIGNRCGPYGCHNGAPFGNASIFSGLGTPEQLLSARCLRNLAVVTFCAFAVEAYFQVSVLTPLGPLFFTVSRLMAAVVVGALFLSALAAVIAGALCLLAVVVVALAIYWTPYVCVLALDALVRVLVWYFWAFVILFYIPFYIGRSRYKVVGI